MNRARHDGHCSVRDASNLTAFWCKPVTWLTLGAISHTRTRDNFTPVKVQLPDGTPLELEDGATGADAARAIGEGLARAALAFRQNGEVRDLTAEVEAGM